MVLTASERLRKKSHYVEHFYVDGGKLFCRFCSHTINHEKKSIVDNHIKSAKHKIGEQKHQTKPQPKQQSLISSINNDREKINIAIIEAFTKADIPLEKIDKLKPFFNLYCKNGMKNKVFTSKI
jgi:hypothetical protein